VFSTLHKPFTDDLACIVCPRLDVDGLFDDRVGPTTERLACPILQIRMEISPDVVVFYLDVAGHTPGMAQSGRACVVRQLLGGNQAGICDILYNGLVGTQDKSRTSGSRKPVVRLLHNTTQVSRAYHRHSFSSVIESLHSKRIPHFNRDLQPQLSSHFLTRSVSRLATPLPRPGCLLWTRSSGPCRCSLAEPELGFAGP